MKPFGIDKGGKNVDINVREIAEAQRDYMIAIRRDLHRHPEMGWKEFRTSQLICDELDKLGVPYVKVDNTTGILATIKCGRPGKTLLMRCDMDALEIQEESDVDFKSENPGISHACGHDGHVAIMLGAIKALAPYKDQMAGTIKCLFQPSEENGTGAVAMIKAGVLDGVDEVFGQHLWTGVPVGKISVEAGPRMASAGFFSIDVKGKSGHGARPQEGIDAVVCSSAIVMNLQSIVSRETDPVESAVVTIGRMDVGEMRNITAENGHMEGTTRTYSPAIRADFENMMDRIIQATAHAYRCTAKLDYYDNVPPVINHEGPSKLAAGSVAKILGEDAVYLFPKTTVGEDFANFLQAKPGLFAFTGVGNPEIDACYAHHNCKFKMDEEGVFNGMMLNIQYALDWTEANAL